jgi:hypothetical protein
MGVTDYNIGGKKLLVFCGERPNVICCASADDAGRKIYFICEISSFHGSEYDVQSCLLGCTAV